MAWVYAYLHQHRGVSLILSQTNSLELIQIMLRFLSSLVVLDLNRGYTGGDLWHLCHHYISAVDK